MDKTRYIDDLKKLWAEHEEKGENIQAAIKYADRVF